MQLRNVLITGGFGFVGVNLVEGLNKTGLFDVTVLDNEWLGKRSHLEGIPANIEIGDIRDEALVDRLIQDTSAVVHLAGETRVVDSVSNPSFNFDVNVRGSMVILEAMRRHGKRRIIFASTVGATIGEAKPPLREDMVPHPISPYGAAKLATEGYLSAYQASYNFLPISLRFSNVYGPRSYHKGSVVAAFFNAYLAGKPISVFGDGSQTRDFIYVGDLAAMIVNCLSSDKTGIYQLGSGRETSLKELLTVMSEVVGKDLFELVSYKPARAGEIYRTFCDISRARSVLGFCPSTDFREGIAKTWSWFQSHAAVR